MPTAAPVLTPPRASAGAMPPNATTTATAVARARPRTLLPIILFPQSLTIPARTAGACQGQWEWDCFKKAQTKKGSSPDVTGVKCQSGAAYPNSVDDQSRALGLPVGLPLIRSVPDAPNRPAAGFCPGAVPNAKPSNTRPQ